MANEIKLKRSAVAGKQPTTSQLGLGEIALNTTDGKAYMKKSESGTESIIEIGATAQPQAQDFVTTAKVISDDYTLDSNRHMLSIHDVEVEDGVTVTVPNDCTWVVVD